MLVMATAALVLAWLPAAALRLARTHELLAACSGRRKGGGNLCWLSQCHLCLHRVLSKRSVSSQGWDAGSLALPGKPQCRGAVRAPCPESVGSGLPSRQLLPISFQKALTEDCSEPKSSFHPFGYHV